VSDSYAADRLIDLETRIAFIERSLIEMSDALAEARRESSADRLRLERALADLREMRGLLPAADAGDEKPPHY
jgi:SlyX protein